MYENNENTFKAGRQVTIIGALVNVILIAFKFTGGIFGNSQALIADAVHSISDFFTDLVALIGLKAGRNMADESHPFGHARIETLASALIGLSLVLVAIYLGIKAVVNIYNHVEYNPTWPAIVASGLSVLLKEILFRYTIYIGRRIKSPVIMANAWHHRSDAFSSVAVLIGVAGAQIGPKWHILDAYAALLVSFFIIKIGIDIIFDSARELTDTAPRPEVLKRIKDIVVTVPAVLSFHELKVRTSAGLYQMEIHIVVNANLTVTEGHQIAKEVESRLHENIEELTQIIIHVDPNIGEQS